MVVGNRTVSNHTVSYNVNVSKGYDLACKAPRSSRVPPNIVIQTCDERCGPCVELVPGNTYLIGGNYSVSDKGAVVWKVPCQNGVASLWSEDYEVKMDKWMSLAAKDRQCSLS